MTLKLKIDFFILHLQLMSAYNNKFKIVMLFKSEQDNIKYTEYCDLIDKRNKIINCDNPNIEELTEILDMIGNTNESNYYYGHAQPFQSNGRTKKYINDNGVLKIESSTWIGDCEQTVETRKNPKNWDSNHKIFVPAIVLFKRIRFMDYNTIANFENKEFEITWNNEKYILAPGQTIEFGSIENPEVKIY